MNTPFTEKSEDGALNKFGKKIKGLYNNLTGATPSPQPKVEAPAVQPKVEELSAVQKANNEKYRLLAKAIDNRLADGTITADEAKRMKSEAAGNILKQSRELAKESSDLTPPPKTDKETIEQYHDRLNRFKAGDPLTKFKAVDPTSSKSLFQKAKELQATEDGVKLNGSGDLAQQMLFGDQTKTSTSDAKTAALVSPGKTSLLSGAKTENPKTDEEKQALKRLALQVLQAIHTSDVKSLKELISKNKAPVNFNIKLEGEWHNPTFDCIGMENTKVSLKAKKDILTLLFKSGVKKDDIFKKNGKSGFISYAMETKHADLIPHLIEVGADASIELVTTSYATCPLPVWACKNGKFEIIEALVKHKIMDINEPINPEYKTSNKELPLAAFLSSYCADLTQAMVEDGIEFFKKMGADFNKLTETFTVQKKPAGSAVLKYSRDNVDLLKKTIAAGLDPMGKTSDDKNLVDLAAEYTLVNCRKYLETAYGLEKTGYKPPIPWQQKQDDEKKKLTAQSGTEGYTKTGISTTTTQPDLFSNRDRTAIEIDAEKALILKHYIPISDSVITGKEVTPSVRDGHPKWTVRGNIEVNDAGLSPNTYGKNSLKVRFEKVYGDMTFKTPLVSTLWGSPAEITGSYIMNNCPEVQTLTGSPTSVGGDFSCIGCTGIKTLQGSPWKLGGGFTCANSTNLTSLYGAPGKIGGDFNCSNTGISVLFDDLPNEIKGNLVCNNCSKLTKMYSSYIEANSALNIRIQGDIIMKGYGTRFKPTDIPKGVHVTGKIVMDQQEEPK